VAGRKISGHLGQRIPASDWIEMLNTRIVTIADFVRAFFYIFLDISGILLGVFLVALGAWVVSGRTVSVGWGTVVLLFGISALFIHAGHYFHLKIASWIFGSGEYFHKNDKKPR
jgi:hypothetical protein